jgi:hypothetical protein
MFAAILHCHFLRAPFVCHSCNTTYVLSAIPASNPTDWRALRTSLKRTNVRVCGSGILFGPSCDDVKQVVVLGAAHRVAAILFDFFELHDLKRREQLEHSFS